MLKYGIDHAGEFAHLFQGPTALVTSPTGRDSRGRATAKILQELCDLKFLLAPEHGLHGSKAAGETFEKETDPKTGLEVLSLYSGSSKRLPEEAFRQADTFVYDIQDVGCRFYTFISTLKLLAQDCAAHGKRLIVLDRPNPLGNRVEGAVLRPERESFVGCHAIPTVYGMTCGEFARMVQGNCDLQVIPCSGWEHDQTFPSWGTEWVRPSPNIPNFETALLYPGTCLIEGTNLSEGRGTDAPFLTIGAPFVNGEALCTRLLDLGLPGLEAAPIRFTPTASKHQGCECGGIRLYITDAQAIRPTEFGIHLLKLIQTMYPQELQLTPGEGGIPFLSQLAGHREFEKPDWDANALIQQARAESARFREESHAFYLY